MELTLEHLNLAMQISKTKHFGQKYGEYDYYEYHVKGVFIRSMGIESSIEVGIVALLHDVVEDTDYPLEKVYELFGSVVGDAVNAITYRKIDETRKQYYQRVLVNGIARVVKRADAAENRYNSVCAGNNQKIRKYDNIVKMMGGTSIYDNR